MLMDDREEKPHGTENAVKFMTLDWQMVCDERHRVSSDKKRGSRVGGRSFSNGVKRKLEPDEGECESMRRKRKKQVVLSNLSLGKKNKKSDGKVYKGPLNSKLGKPESREDPRVGRGESGCGGSLGDIVCSLNNSFKIPKRPRDLVRRKKVEVDVLPDNKGILAEGGKVAVSADGALLGNGNANEILVTNRESQGTSNGSVIMNGKRKKNCHGHNVNKSESLDLIRHMKRDDLCSFLCNDNLVMKKARRKHKKKNGIVLGSPGLTVEANQSLDVSSRICDDSQDDEENLEANAARMLSSRFDPSCTGFPCGRKSSKVTSENRLSALISHNRELAIGLSDNKDKSAVASSDIEARILQPRDRHKVKGRLRERRRFYAVVFKDLDAYWVLNRRIKVFWPLDQSWYIGHIIGYDPDKNLHHVKYDDREEEWIDLQRERFKLFLFPSEVPGKGRRISLTAQSRKEKHGEITKSKEMINGSSMESEPIISWLVRSSNRKSSTIGVKKKKRTLPSVLSHSCDLSKGKSEPIGCLDVASGLNADSSASGSVLPNNVGGFYNKKPISESCLSNSDRAPIVYFRKRFHRREKSVSSVREGEMFKLSTKPLAYQNVPDSVDSIDFDGDASPSNGECDEPSNRLSSDELVWDTDCFGELKLIKPIIRLEVCGFDFSSHLSRATSNMVQWQSDMFMLQYGTLISMWPMIHLEILFVDNVVGLWFLIFEGCMKQAVSFVFLVLAVFCQSNYLEMHDNEELPVTSIRFRFSGLHYLEKGLVFLFYNFSQLEKFKWSFLNKKLKKRCILTKELSPPDCSADNIEAFRNDCSQLNLTDISQKHFSEMNLRKRSRHCETHSSSRPSACFKLSRVAFGCDKKPGRLAPFSLLYATAPTFFFSLHLRLLMERSKSSSSFRNQGSVYMLNHPENEPTVLSLPVEDNSLVLPSGISELDHCSDVDFAVKNVSVDHDEDITTKPSHVSQDSGPHMEKVKTELNENVQRRPTAQSLDPDYHIGNVDTKMKDAHLNGLTVDIQSFVPVPKDADTDVQNIEHSIDAALDTNDEACSPNPTTSLSSWGRIRNGNSYPSTSANLSPGWVDRKQDILQSGFGHGPKRPRTQVSYSLPLGGQECNSKSKFHQSKGFSHKRIRRASEKKTCEAFGTCQRNVEPLCCEANILVTVGDRGWREFGAKIVIELFDHNEWRLAVKISGITRYSYKALQFVQPGTTNRYTHAMMWKGGKDWILEFTDRSQWTTFKEMHEECCNRNFRAASVKNIPIPGVRLVEENDDNVPEVPYMRPYSNYHRQDETDIDIAMDPSRVLYDMDSDDERWIMKHRDSDFNESGCGYVSDEMFERIIDVLEKLAYAQQRESFTLEELEDATAEIGPLEAIEIIYEHWREKRQKKGMPLVRYLQPPLWEKYQQQVKEWEQAVAKSNISLTGGCQDKPSIIEKPPMFAFCLKPRGLDTPNRGSKQRSQKKLPVGALSNGVPGDADAYHSLVGRRLSGLDLGDDRVVYTACYLGTSDSSPVLQGSTRVFSPRDSGALGYFSLNSDGYETNHVAKLYRNKSKKLCLMSSSNNQPPVASSSYRTPGRRSSVHLWGLSEWPSQMHCQLEGYYRQNFEPLDPAEIEEFRLRDASSAARHAVSIAKMKRENAQRMLCRADLAMHKAVAAIMTAEAVKASYKDPNSDVELSG